VIGIGWGFSYYYNNELILYAAVFFAIVMNVISFWYSDKITIKSAGAIPALDSEFPDLHNTVENLAITAGLPKPKIYIINDPVPNAFATGRNKEHAAIAVTSGLLAILEPSELEGVLAHELSHIGNRDILVMTVAVVLGGFVALLANFFLRSSFWGGNDRSERGGGVVAIVGILLAVLAPIFATLIQLAISRKREFLADASGALLTRYPEGLARALEKISSNTHPMKRANKATAHMFIASPFGANSRSQQQRAGFWSRLFMTHPPIEERIAALRGME
jgi:heat shock protein HtpX